MLYIKYFYRKIFIHISLLILFVFFYGYLQSDILKGYDLTGQWKYTSKDNPDFAKPDWNDSDWEKVNLPENKKSVSVGWYRLTIQLPGVSSAEQKFLGTELMIGNIIGNSAIYFNGTLVGETRGSGIYSQGRPQSYVIPPDIIRFGKENIISIRVTGLGGGKSIGITGKPITLSPLGDSYLYQRMLKLEDKYSVFLRQYADVQWNDKKFIKKTMKQNEALVKMYQSARQLQSGQRLKNLHDQLDNIELTLNNFEKDILHQKSEEEDENSTETEELPLGWLKNESKFGMLGRLYQDGLMLFNSNPAGFDYKLGADAPYSVRYYGITPNRMYITRMNWITKSIRVEGKRGKRDTSYEVTHSSVFPGVMVNVFDKEFSFTYTNAHAKAPDYLGYTNEFVNTIIAPINPKIKKRESKVITDINKVNLPMSRNWLVFWFTEKYGTRESYPLLVVFEKPFKQILLEENEEGVTVMTLKSNQELGRLVFIYPLGIDGLKGKESNILQTGFTRDFINICNFWGYCSLQFPIECDEYYRLDESSTKMEIVTKYKYQELENSWKSGQIKLAPIPPALSRALVHDYPVEFPAQGLQAIPKTVSYNKIYPGINLLMKTKFGEYGTFVGKSDAHYKLPLPSLESNDTVNRSIGDSSMIKDELIKLLNESVKELCYPTAQNAVDRGYKGNTQSWMAYRYLNETNRNRLWQSATTSINLAFDPDIWNYRTEPFSRDSYMWTYYLEGPYYEMYDIDWGNGLPIYGIEKYSQYSKDWNTVKENWERIKEANRYFSIADSWTWMSVSNADLGHGTGAGDCLTVSYVANISMARMAKQLGDSTTYQKSLYQAAKSSVSMLSRFWMNEYAQTNQMTTDAEYVIGYFEDDGVLAVSKNDDPWHMTSVLSGNGVQPEVFDLYMKYAKDALMDYENKFELFYPNWFDGDFKYNRRLTYPDNSGYTTIPHIYSRYRLGYPQNKILDYIRQAQKNRQMWWVAPNVLAEIVDSYEK